MAISTKMWLCQPKCGYFLKKYGYFPPKYGYFHQNMAISAKIWLFPPKYGYFHKHHAVLDKNPSFTKFTKEPYTNRIFGQKGTHLI